MVFAANFSWTLRSLFSTMVLSAQPRARSEVQHILKPLVVSWGYEVETPGPSKYIDQFEWTGTRDIASFLSVPAAIEFQQVHDWERVRQACHELVKEAKERICALFE